MTSSSSDPFGDFVTVAPGLGIQALETVTNNDGDYDVEVDVVPERGRLVAQEVRISRKEGGPPVTGEGIRAVPVAALTKLAALGVWEKTEADGVTQWRPGRTLSPEVTAPLRENGPTTETLENVAYVYRVALLMGEAPTKAIEQVFGIPRSTAGRWVTVARQQGFLGTAEGPGKAGG